MNEAQPLGEELIANSQLDSIKPFLIFLFLFFIVWTLRATALFFIDRSLGSGVAIQIYSNAVKFLLWVVPAIVFVKVFDGRNPLEYLKMSTAINKKGYAAIAIFAYFAVVLLIEILARGRNLDVLYERSIVESLKILLLTSVSALWEEILFRGFAQIKLGERMSFLKSNLLTSFLFVAIHWPHWLWRDGFQPSMVVTSASIFILACFLGYLVKKTNSLWPSVAAHVVNNFIAGSLRP